MPKELEEVGSDVMPETIWTLIVEKVTNQDGKSEYVISIPEKMKKYMKLKDGDSLFWGERAKNMYEVRKASNEDLHRFKIQRASDESIREGKAKLRTLY